MVGYGKPLSSLVVLTDGTSAMLIARNMIMTSMQKATARAGGRVEWSDEWSRPFRRCRDACSSSTDGRSCNGGTDPGSETYDSPATSGSCLVVRAGGTKPAGFRGSNPVHTRGGSGEESA